MSAIYAQMNGHMYTLVSPASVDEAGTLRADFVDHLTGVHVPVAINHGTEQSEYVHSIEHGNSGHTGSVEHGNNGHHGHVDPECSTPEPSALFVVPIVLVAMVRFMRSK